MNFISKRNITMSNAINSLFTTASKVPNLVKSGVALLSAITLLQFIFVATALSEHYWQVEVPRLPQYTNSKLFNIEYTVLSVDANDKVHLTLYQNGQPAGTKVASGSQGASGVFQVSVAKDGTYEFYVSATSSVDDSVKQTQKISTVVDTVAPTPPMFTGAARNDRTYNLQYTAPEDRDVRELRFYSSTEKEFMADEESLVGVVPVKPGQKGTFTYTASTQVHRHHAVQSYDRAGNYSELVADHGTDAVQGVIPASEEAVLAASTDRTNLSGDGVIDTKAATVTESGDVKSASTQRSGNVTNDLLVAGIFGLPVLAILLYYLFAIKKYKFPWHKNRD